MSVVFLLYLIISVQLYGIGFTRLGNCGRHKTHHASQIVDFNFCFWVLIHHLPIFSVDIQRSNIPKVCKGFKSGLLAGQSSVKILLSWINFFVPLEGRIVAFSLRKIWIGAANYSTWFKKSRCKMRI